MLRREATARDDLTAGETSWCLGNRPLGSLGSKEHKLKGGDRRGEVDAGVGTATSVRRRYSAGGAGALSGEEARERACEGVRLGARARRGNNTA
jgi:hypothetical protein